MHFPKQIEIIEVGPRDGLQNEASFVPTDEKKQLIKQLYESGFQRIETASFVHPKIVPQMADAQEITSFCNELGLDYIALTPNMKALERAIEAGVPQIAVFVGASETFNQKNIKRSIADSLEECSEMFQQAKAQHKFIRGYVSMCFSCPYEGAISYEQVKRVVEQFVKDGADEISIGDTNGQANPRIVYERFSALKRDFPQTTFVAHFHDTNGFAYANIIAALNAGIEKFDSSIAGLGGCPFSPGATGNVATEKVVELFEAMQIKTNIQQEKLKDVSAFASNLV
ncbi:MULTISPECIES: hydroxymethylglutaryl-CoA lyase [Solibacillus]|uniref:Hydroxymethylglutaryl-CoA lyase n=1 Tax=Solibacillus merdavium TaxID=2762218 RepID=A0ABR8XSN8_9BACL|nr:hydroxymethylglutaryl-CoA lyase [Solibacillus merdavium]MBD8034968.1 hydroxymethylglutaryl-CoA lyase [Solibacillus merdavium]